MSQSAPCEDIVTENEELYWNLHDDIIHKSPGRSLPIKMASNWLEFNGFRGNGQQPQDWQLSGLRTVRCSIKEAFEILLLITNSVLLFFALIAEELRCRPRRTKVTIGKWDSVLDKQEANRSYWIVGWETEEKPLASSWEYSNSLREDKVAWLWIWGEPLESCSLINSGTIFNYFLLQFYYLAVPQSYVTYDSAPQRQPQQQPTASAESQLPDEQTATQ